MPDARNASAQNSSTAASACLLGGKTFTAAQDVVRARRIFGYGERNEFQEMKRPDLKMTQSFLDFRQLVAVAGDAIIASDPQGVITLWNEAATRIFGFSEAEALGRNLDLIIPDKFRKRHWEGYEATVASGTTRYGATLLKVPALHKDGRNLSIAFTVALLTSANKVTQIVAIVRDETSRWNEERELRRRLRALEEAAGGPAMAPDNG
jgi:PAS domain S-box-containing protein